MTEKKEVKEVKKAKKYPIIKHKVLGEGYTAKIDDTYFTIDAQERRVVVRGGVRVSAVTRKSDVYQSDKPLRIDEETGAVLSGGVEANSNGGEYFLDLTKEQERQLAIAKIIAYPKDKNWWKVSKEV